MEYRSSNAGQHLSNDVVAGVGSSHGVQLRGGSTGGTISAVGDDTDIVLTLDGKGAGGVVIGSGSQFQGAFSTTFAYAFTALSSGDTVESAILSTTADVNPGDVISIELGLPAVSTQTISLLHFRTSTVASSRVVLTLGNITSTAIGSTGSGTGRISWIDLT